MVSIALVKSHSETGSSARLLSDVEHNSLLFSPAFIFIPYLRTLLLTCIIKVGPLSVTSAPSQLLSSFFFFLFSRQDERFKESPRMLHFRFLPLDGVKLFLTAGISLPPQHAFDFERSSKVSKVAFWWRWVLCSMLNPFGGDLRGV